MVLDGRQLFGQSAVGGEYKRAAVGCAVGAGVCGGAADDGDGTGDEDAAER